MLNLSCSLAVFDLWCIRTTVWCMSLTAFTSLKSKTLTSFFKNYIQLHNCITLILVFLNSYSDQLLLPQQFKNGLFGQPPPTDQPNTMSPYRILPHEDWDIKVESLSLAQMGLCCNPARWRLNVWTVTNLKWLVGKLIALRCLNVRLVFTMNLDITQRPGVCG